MYLNWFVLKLLLALQYDNAKCIIQYTLVYKLLQIWECGMNNTGIPFECNSFCGGFVLNELFSIGQVEEKCQMFCLYKSNI